MLHIKLKQITWEHFLTWLAMCQVALSCRCWRPPSDYRPHRANTVRRGNTVVPGESSHTAQDCMNTSWEQWWWVHWWFREMIPHFPPQKKPQKNSQQTLLQRQARLGHCGSIWLLTTPVWCNVELPPVVSDYSTLSPLITLTWSLHIPV